MRRSNAILRISRHFEENSCALLHFSGGYDLSAYIKNAFQVLMAI